MQISLNTHNETGFKYNLHQTCCKYDVSHYGSTIMIDYGIDFLICFMF